MASNYLVYSFFFEFLDNRNNERAAVDLFGSQLKPSPFREDGHAQIYNERDVVRAVPLGCLL